MNVVFITSFQGRLLECDGGGGALIGDGALIEKARATRGAYWRRGAYWILKTLTPVSEKKKYGRKVEITEKQTKHKQ